jgi:hypothetical protein
MEEYLRVATPDIPALFPRPAWNLSCRLNAEACDMARLMDDYGAKHLEQDKAEAEYRARREEAKVWKRERDEESRRVLEARALQAQKYRDDLASRVERMMENEEEERLAGERRAREAERVQIEKKKRGMKKKGSLKRKEERRRRGRKKRRRGERRRRGDWRKSAKREGRWLRKPLLKPKRNKEGEMSKKRPRRE